MPELTMSELGLGTAIYFDHELAADPAPIAALWRRIANRPGPRQWWSTPRTSHKPVALDLEALVAKVASGALTAAAIESEDRGLLAMAAVTRGDALDPGFPPRAWKYDAVIAIGPAELAAIGRPEVLDALCTFAGAVDAQAGIVVWSRSLDYARALAMLASGNELTPEKASGVTDAYYWRSQWGRVIRGPEWGTFLSPRHVEILGDPARLPAARVVRLASGGAFVQLTVEPVEVEIANPQLAALRDALASVMPSPR
jgi:hypothetical protein